MAKLIIEITGTEEEIQMISGHLSDGGGEPGLTPYNFEDGRYLSFEYKRCFEGWGYDPKKHGPDRVVTVTVVKDSNNE